MMKFFSALVLGVFIALPIGVRGQTQAELEADFLAHAAAMRTLCEAMQPPSARCFVVTKIVEAEPTVCPDPLVGTRQNVEQATANITETQEAILSMRTWFDNLSTTQLEQARQALDQLLVDNPAP